MRQKKTKKASETYTDTTSPVDMEFEEMSNPGILTDEKLRRETPKRYDQQIDWISQTPDHGNDSPIGTRSSLKSDYSSSKYLGERLAFTRIPIVSTGSLSNNLLDKIHKKYACTLGAYPEISKFISRLEIKGTKAKRGNEDLIIFIPELHELEVPESGVLEDDIIEYIAEVIEHFTESAGIDDYLDKQKAMYDDMSELSNEVETIFWESKASQSARFDVLLDLGDFENNSLLDVGCGFGDIIDYAASTGIEFKEYKGVDLSQEIIDKAKELHPEHDFEILPVTGMDFKEESYDYVIASGIFTLAGKNWDTVVQQTVKALYGISAKGIGINFLRGKEHLSRGKYQVTTPEYVMNLLGEDGEYTLKADYLPDNSDFTIFINKENMEN